MSPSSQEAVETLFLRRSLYYLGVEYPAKVRRAFAVIPDEVIWDRPAEGTNSVGNLILHLSGNLCQWVVSGIGGAPDRRDRDREFSARGGMDRIALLALIDETFAAVTDVLNGLDAQALQQLRTIQGRETTVFSALYHAVEHASGHVGQLIYIAKVHRPEAIQFYEDTGGLARPTFLPPEASDID